MRKLRWEEYFAVPAMVILISASLLFVPPPANAYSVPNTASAAITTMTQTQPLTVAAPGDLIVIAAQLHANGAPDHVVGVSGILGDTSYTLAELYGYNFGIACAAACASSEIWYATATSAGADSITITTSGTCSSACGYEMIDLQGIGSTILSHSAQNGTGPDTTFITPSSLPLSGASTFAISSQVNGCTNGHFFTAGTGYTALIPVGSNWGGAEYGTPSTGPASPTNFSMTCDIGVTNWIDLGVVFGGPTSVIVVIPCTAFQLQCWWYPFFFFGVYMILIVGMAVKAKVPKPDLLGLTIEAFSLASLLAVMLGIINIMFPLIITVVQVIRAIRE